ncbi:hypothetical protein SAMN04488109_1201 [Chryseolinea serpens]|uniref:Uncharacterized protein n=1 Tax=Chryseolinea serpens TaxID=947013 RepID=A0A1M5LGW4_9BACT|nr:hypothetical protein [Chryseolinea serpens]SHG64190.1 hypothetical protein SAMN04488109_1201 [Chryseolinea serpens]
MKTLYGIDFDGEYAKIIPLFSSVHSLQVEERGQDIEMRDIAAMLERNEMGPETRSYHHLENLVRLFDDEQSNASVIGAFNRFKDQIISDPELSDSEKRRLVMALTTIASNYDGIAKGITSSMREASNERTQGLFNRVWRVIRSVIITSTIGAAIGATEGPVGAIIGAAVTTTAAVSDAQFNHNCHFALQCDGGWRQDCMTGECKPYAQ